MFLIGLLTARGAASVGRRCRWLLLSTAELSNGVLELSELIFEVVGLFGKLSDLNFGMFELLLKVSSVGVCLIALTAIAKDFCT